MLNSKKSQKNTENIILTSEINQYQVRADSDSILLVLDRPVTRSFIHSLHWSILSNIKVNVPNPVVITKISRTFNLRAPYILHKLHITSWNICREF